MPNQSLLRSNLSVTAYTLPPTMTTDYSDLIESLSFTTVAPGGCGDFSGKIKLKDARLPHLELGLFARIAVMAGTDGLWVGELTDPENGLSDSEGEYVQLTGLGLGNCLRDDPRDDSYSASTVQTMAVQQMTSRSAFLRLDPDTSALFPDNPAGSYTLQFAGNNQEEVMAQFALLAGDYMWGVWPHPQYSLQTGTHVDGAGFPTGQLQAHLRDSSTVHYYAFEDLGDVLTWRIIPSAERAFNVIKIRYNDPAHNPPVAYATATDPRLGAGGAQGTAPFPRRVYLQDLTAVNTVTAAQAQAIANSYLAQFMNVTNKIEIVLAVVRNNNGMPLDLFRARADRNILVPNLSYRGQTLPTTAIAGTNLFYIVESKYEEDQQTQKLTLQCDNFVDTANIQIARLQLQADALSRQGTTTVGAIQAQGAPINGVWSTDFSNEVAAGNHGGTLPFPATCMLIPTSITMSAQSSGNVSGVTVANRLYNGAHVYAGVTANGAGFWWGTYATVGN